ncbi:MAG TPA: FliI/YscN family ATPase [Phycisphaerae bacterium]|jgi:FliI/YscN family ATPase
MNVLARQLALIDSAQTIRVTGRVRDIVGLTVVAEGLPLPVGAMCLIRPRATAPVEAEVIGFQGARTVLLPLSLPQGIAAGAAVESTAAMQSVAVGRQMLGRTVDGLGRPLDGRPPFRPEACYPIHADPPPPMQRRAIDAPLPTGVRAIDAMHTVGCGQRMGIFSGTGVGKSTLLSMIARNTAADVNVVALVGERGREVGDFIRELREADAREAEQTDGAERVPALERTVMVVSTSDESPVLRVRACFVATAIAEYFRDQGGHVLLLIDSLTRLAMAQRQIGLAAGEPPATKGYTPSVFALLPRLLERSGAGVPPAQGSITGLYSVLVEGDDLNDPIGDAVRGILDGHIWLSRTLANRGYYPAISVLESISRVMPDIVDAEHLEAARQVRRTLAVWSDIEDMVNIGAYARGASAEFDAAVDFKPRIDQLLTQGVHERATLAETRARLVELAAQIGAARKRS